MKRYHINYFCCFLSIFAAIVSAATHQLGLLLLNFFFAMYNWYVAEWLRAREENEETINRNEFDTDEDDSEDKE